MHATVAVLIFIKVQQYFHLQTVHIILSVALEVSAGGLLIAERFNMAVARLNSCLHSGNLHKLSVITILNCVALLITNMT